MQGLPDADGRTTREAMIAAISFGNAAIASRYERCDILAEPVPLGNRGSAAAAVLTLMTQNERGRQGSGVLFCLAVVNIAGHFSNEKSFF
jgi:hypothetical protein